MNTSTSSLLMRLSDPSAEERLAEIQGQLQKLEKRDWWLWSMAVIVMLLLTFAVFSMTFPGLIKVDDPFFESGLERAVRGLIGLVLIFNAYTIYQQVMVKRLRRQFSTQIEEMRILQARAEEFQRLAMVDPLTGLSNRRVAEERLASEASRSGRYGHALTVVALDLDKFKQINDTYGHLTGDLVLKNLPRGCNLRSACPILPRAWAATNSLCSFRSAPPNRSAFSSKGCVRWRSNAAGKKSPFPFRLAGSGMNREKPRRSSWSAPIARCTPKNGQEN